jgi:hypothetical protein
MGRFVAARPSRRPGATAPWARALLCVAGAALFAAGAALAKDKEKPKPAEPLRYVPTYAEAWAEARLRNVPVYLVFLKDNCGACNGIRRSLLVDPAFAAWANEHLVLLVGHSDPNHPADVEGPDGKPVAGCPVYPGLLCEQHRQVDVDVEVGENGLPRIAVGNDRPTAFLLSPGGDAVRVAGSALYEGGMIREKAEAVQKAAGAPVTRSQHEAYGAAFAAVREAAEAGRFKDALKAFQAVEKEAKKVPPSYAAEVDARRAALDAAVRAAFEKLRDAEGGEDAARLKKVVALRQEAGQRLAGGYLPSIATIDAWIREARAKEK